MSENYCETLAEIYIAKKEDYDDWNKHISCLCSRVIIRNYVPSTFLNDIKNIEDHKNYELLKECDDEINNFDSSTEEDNVINVKSSTTNSCEKIICKKRIRICEFNCIFTLYFVTKDNNSLDQYYTQYKQIQSYNTLLSQYYIFLENTSLLFYRKLLHTIVEFFILKDSNFINNCILNRYEQQVTYHLLTPQSFHQLQQHDIISNHKLLHYCRFADYLLKKSSFQFQWDDFWLTNGDYITKLSWTLKYKDYIHPDQLKATYNEIWKISVNTSKCSIQQVIQEQIKHLKREKAVKSKYKKLRKFTNSEILSEKYVHGKQISLITNLETQLEGDSNLYSNDALIVSENEDTWQYLWQNHYQEQYSKSYFFFHEHCVKQADILKKFCFISNFLCLKKNTNSNLFINCLNKILNNAHYDFFEKVIYQCIISEQLLETNEFYKNPAQQDVYELSSDNVNDEYQVENIDLDKVVNALKLMGFAYENINGDSLKGEVIFKKKNIKFYRRFLKNKWSHINQFPIPKSNKMYPANGKNDIVVNLYIDSNGITKDLNAKHPNEENFAEYENHGEIINNIVNDNLNENLDMNNKQSDNFELESNSHSTKKVKKRKKRSKRQNKLPEHVQKNPILKKYWLKRYRLFSKFDEGIKLDDESWFSVTPEKVAKHIAERCRSDILIDAFCGAGGNSISFAFTCERVYAIDIDPQKIEMARHNARIYGVEDRIEFIIGDFFCLAERLFGDVVFLSPPWGGPSYIHDKTLDMQNIMDPIGGVKLFEVSKKISDNIAYYLPKNINTLQLAMTAGPGSKIELEQNFLDTQLIAVTAYYGELSQ